METNDSVISHAGAECHTRGGREREPVPRAWRWERDAVPAAEARLRKSGRIEIRDSARGERERERRHKLKKRKDQTRKDAAVMIGVS